MLNTETTEYADPKNWVAAMHRTQTIQMHCVLEKQNEAGIIQLLLLHRIRDYAASKSQ